MFDIGPVEERLFRELLMYNEELGLQMTFRVAGGWVRDKLMQIPCDDIDIAIDKSSGAVFTNGFMEYLQGKSQEVHGYHVIECNHEKSKHLETASLKYMGLSVDFVALRIEEYTETRIPIVRTGTPQEDANRRDITINALFYNINTKSIEDYTGRGLSDIKEGKIRTPLDPMETFLDDPLRILRVLRFASRLSFEIVPEILCVLGEKKLHSKLTQVVSKERVGYEIKKTLLQEGYKKALAALAEYQIAQALFPDAAVTCEEVCRFMDALEFIQSTPGHPVHGIEKTQIYLLRIFALLQNNFGARKGKETLTEHMVKENLKWTKIERTQISSIEKKSAEIDALVDLDIPEEDRLVRVARRLGEHLEHSLTLYDIQQRAKNTQRIDIIGLYNSIVTKGYKEAYLEKHVVEFSVVKDLLQIGEKDVSRYMERCTQLSLVHKTKDPECILPLLKQEFDLHKAEQKE
ncbi:hypothetical protein NEAUS06_1281 [Nematocida ausubeli]|nr:hypothetical protein NEAUS06_1281 [Nematocida ausubeli]